MIRVIDNQNEKCIIVLGAMLPGVKDTRPMINTFAFRNDKLATRCPGDVRLEHARPGKHLLGSKGPIMEYYDEFGNLNEFGGDVIARALERQIFSAKIFQKYRVAAYQLKRHCLAVYTIWILYLKFMLIIIDLSLLCYVLHPGGPNCTTRK